MKSSSGERLTYTFLATAIVCLMVYLVFEITVGAQPTEDNVVGATQFAQSETQFGAPLVGWASIEQLIQNQVQRDRIGPIVTPTPIPTKPPTPTPTPIPPPWPGDAWQLVFTSSKTAKIIDMYKQTRYVKLGEVYDGNVKVLELRPPNSMVLQDTRKPERTREVVKGGKPAPDKQ